MKQYRASFTLPPIKFRITHGELLLWMADNDYEASNADAIEDDDSLEPEYDEETIDRALNDWFDNQATDIQEALHDIDIQLYAYDITIDRKPDVDVV